MDILQLVVLVGLASAAVFLGLCVNRLARSIDSVSGRVSAERRQIGQVVTDYLLHRELTRVEPETEPSDILG